MTTAARYLATLKPPPTGPAPLAPLPVVTPKPVLLAPGTGIGAPGGAGDGLRPPPLRPDMLKRPTSFQATATVPPGAAFGSAVSLLSLLVILATMLDGLDL